MRERLASLLESRFVIGLISMIFLFLNIFMLKFGLLLFICPDYKWLLFFARVLFIALYVFVCIKIEKDYFSLLRSEPVIFVDAFEGDLFQAYKFTFYLTHTFIWVAVIVTLKCCLAGELEIGYMFYCLIAILLIGIVVAIWIGNLGARRVRYKQNVWKCYVHFLMFIPIMLITVITLLVLLVAVTLA